MASLFSGEMNESLESISKMVDQLELFKELYDDYRENIIPFMVNSVETRRFSLNTAETEYRGGNGWEFASHLVFAKYDTCINRVKQIKVPLREYSTTRNKLIVGKIRSAKILSESIFKRVQIFSDSTVLYVHCILICIAIAVAILPK